MTRNEVFIWKHNKSEPDKTPFVFTSERLPEYLKVSELGTLKSSYFKLLNVSFKGKAVYHETLETPSVWSSQS